jgi:C-terminal processing protease CtpA/Prc
MAGQTPSFGKFKREIFQAINEEKVKKLIFDIQFNPEGSSRQGTKFIKQLAKNKIINLKGKLFVIIGRRTFSSAIINTYDFKKYTNAILVGEETAARLNHYGEIKKTELPTSHLKIYYSTKYFQLDNKNKDLNTVKPDIEIEN